MKRILAVICCFSLLFCVAACGNATQNRSSTEGSSSASSKSMKSKSMKSKSMKSKSMKSKSMKSKTIKSKSSTAAPQQTQPVEKINVQIGGSAFTATLENNCAVDAFVEMMQLAPVVLLMRDNSGFEKVGSVGISLPAANSQTTTQSGDIVLYGANQIVIFYGSNSWSYTRLGRIDDLSGWEEALGRGDVTVTFSIGQRFLQ